MNKAVVLGCNYYIGLSIIRCLGREGVHVVACDYDFDNSYGAKSKYISEFLKIDDLKKNYGDPYNRAYDEIRQELEILGFEWIQGSLYVNSTEKNTLAEVYKAITKLKSIEWFKNSVRDIRAFKVEDWSDFTAIVKE